jgi:hypothetical protein
VEERDHYEIQPRPAELGGATGCGCSAGIERPAICLRWAVASSPSRKVWTRKRRMPMHCKPAKTGGGREGIRG